jgi:hypothetical protein
MMVGRFAFSEKRFQNALESTPTVVNDIQLELLPIGY